MPALDPLAAVRARDTGAVRHLIVRKETLNEEDRTVELAFSSETPVERYFGFEVLDHGPGGCDLSLLNDEAPLLKDHDERRQIGVIVKGSAKVDGDRTGRCTVRFSKSTLGEEEFQDVKDGIRTKISCGYDRTEGVLQSETNGERTYRFKWRPLEVSTVAIPADNAVGVGRGAPAVDSTTPTVAITDSRTQPITAPPPTMSAAVLTEPAKPTPTVDLVAERSNAVAADRERAKEIRAIAKKFECADDGDRFIADGKSVNEFRAHVLESRGNAKPVTLENPEIGMDQREVARYSIVRAMRRLGNKQPLDGLELEASNAVAKRTGTEAQGFFIPADVTGRSLASARGLDRAATRALAAEIASAGGYTIQENVLAGSMIELLRNKMRLAGMGCTVLSGLMGNIAIPRVTGGASAYWLAEGADTPPADQNFGQLGLTPKRLAAQTAYSKQLLIQSSLDVEAFVRNDLMRVMALEQDRAGINGTGADGEPTGILHTNGISAITFGGAATYGKIVDMETALGDQNADEGSLGYLTTPGVRGKLKQTPVLGNTNALPIWSNNQVNGYNAQATKQVPGNRVIFGNFADLILANWDGMDVTVDPYTLAGKNQVRIVICLQTDTGVRHSASFVASSDAGNQ